jgi:hypothetical protein
MFLRQRDVVAQVGRKRRVLVQIETELKKATSLFG